MKTNKVNQAHVPSNESDDFNPEYIFSLTATELLVAIANGHLDARELAIKQLRNRGQDLVDGTWLGIISGQRYANLLEKYQLMLQPTQVILQGLESNEFTDLESYSIRKILELIKEEKFMQAMELALVSGDTVKFYTLTKLKK